MKETINIKQWLKDIVTTIHELSAPYYHLTAKRLFSEATGIEEKEEVISKYVAKIREAKQLLGTMEIINNHFDRMRNIIADHEEIVESLKYELKKEKQLTGKNAAKILALYGVNENASDDTKRFVIEQYKRIKEANDNIKRYEHELGILKRTAKRSEDLAIIRIKKTIEEDKEKKDVGS